MMRVTTRSAARYSPPLTCPRSDTLTTDQACTGDGFIVSGDGITIDLGGFTLSGERHCPCTPMWS